MNKQFYPIIISTLLCVLPLGASAEQLVKQFSGNSSTNTLEFEVKSPWLLDWRVSGDHSRVVAVDVAMFGAGTGTYEGIILRTKYPGNGVKLFNNSGRFYFRVDAALMNWNLKVIQLTDEEAKQYTPKSSSMLDD
jgi:hypothetical protein